jgi:hypothetical protein
MGWWPQKLAGTATWAVSHTLEVIMLRGSAPAVVPWMPISVGMGAAC